MVYWRPESKSHSMVPGLLSVILWSKTFMKEVRWEMRRRSDAAPAAAVGAGRPPVHPPGRGSRAGGLQAGQTLNQD